MKKDIFKKFIKQAVKEAINETVKGVVKEAIQEELKDILREAVISNKQPLKEHSLPPVNLSSVPTPEAQPGDIRQNYMSVLDNMMNPTTNSVPSNFTPNPGSDSVNGELPGGDVSMDQITKLMIPQ